MTNELKIFKNEELGMEVRCLLINDETWLVGKDIVESLGYEIESVSYSKYIKNNCDEEDYTLMNKSTLDLFTNYQELGRKGGYLVNESGMYALVFGSDLPSAKQFKRWVTKEVLPSIRKNGAYISNNEEKVDQGYIKYAYGQLKNTFSDCPIENIIETYEDCMEWHKKNKTKILYAKNSKKRSDAKHTHSESKVMIMQKITTVLESRNLSLMENNKFGLISEVDSVIKQIKDDIGKQNNVSNRGKIANKTKKINKLQEEINYHNPNIDEFLEIPIHGMSVNYMYTNYIYNGELCTRKSDSYKRWIDRFPNELIINQFSDIDLNKPTKLWLKFDAVNKFDADNMVKSIQDQITKVLGFTDDNNIQLGSVEINKRVDKYSYGKIFVLLKNVK